MNMMIPLLLWLWHGTNISHPSNPAIYSNHHLQFPTWNLAPPKSLRLLSTSRLWLFPATHTFKIPFTIAPEDESIMKAEDGEIKKLFNSESPYMKDWYSIYLRSFKRREHLPHQDRVTPGETVSRVPEKKSATLHFLNEASMDSNHHEAAMAIDCKACSLQTC